MKFRKKPIVVEATQWFKNGDHPQDASFPLQPKEGEKEVVFMEGRVVRYYRNPTVLGIDACPKCLRTMHDHGWIDDVVDGQIVCPGDWVITGVDGRFHVCKPEMFSETYESLEIK